MKRPRTVLSSIAALVIVALTYSTAHAIDPADLQGYWAFDNSNNLGEDSGPNGNHLVSPGTPTYLPNGRIGGAVDIDGPGSDDPLRQDRAFPVGIPTGDASYSVTAWVNPDDNNPAGGGIISWGNNNGNEKNATRTSGRNQYHHYWWGNDLSSAGGLPDQWAGNPPDGWHHVAVTYDHNTDDQRWYVDGGLSNQRNAGGLNPQPTNFFIGLAAADNETLNGQLDEVAVFSGVLSAEDVGFLAAGNSVGALVIPEPSSLMLAAIALFAFGFCGRRVRK